MYLLAATKSLARFTAETEFDGLPDRVIVEAKRVILDTIGCALAGYTHDLGRISVSYVRDLGGKPESTIIGCGEKTSCLNAAYANARMANALDYDDTFVLVGHIACTAVPASLAVAERVKATGKDLIEAVVLGWEIGARIGFSMGPPFIVKENRLKGYLPSYSITPHEVFAAVASATKLLELDEGQTAHAFGIAGANSPIPSSAPWGAAINDLPLYKHLDAGWNAMTGIAGALLAQKGITGYSTILDGDRGYWRMYGYPLCDFDALTTRLGEEWHIRNVMFKPWPCCRYIHHVLTAFSKMVQENDLKPEEITKVVVLNHHPGTLPKFRVTNPRGAIGSQFSIPHAIAMIVFGITPGPRWHSPDVVNDPEVLKLRRKVTVKLHPKAFDLSNIKKRAVSVKVTLRDGKVLTESTEYAKGDPWSTEMRMTDDDCINFTDYGYQLLFVLRYTASDLCNRIKNVSLRFCGS